MKISRTKHFTVEAAPALDALLVWAGAPRWIALRTGALAERGEGEFPLDRPARAVLVVPGDEVAIHWVDLPPGLAPAQAAAAARLAVADRTAQPLSEMHVAAGGREADRTCVAMAPADRMTGWLAAAAERGIDPDLIVPEPLLLLPPLEGLARWDGAEPAAWRGVGQAFSLEPELAEPLVGDAAVIALDETDFLAGLPHALAVPKVDLRQGDFARRRQLRFGWNSVRRLAVLALLLFVATLGVQVAAILQYTFAADALEAEAAGLGAGAAPAAAPGFSENAALLFDAVRTVPNVELASVSWQGDGALRATVYGDSPATLAALRQRLEASGASVQETGAPGGGGRAAAELTVRTR